jgi:hypothetical protein
MAGYVKQHYVPIFLLNKWVGSDGWLSQYYWFQQKLKIERKGPRMVACQKALVNFKHRRDTPRHTAESKFFGPKIDGPAALVLNTLILNGAQALSAEEHWIWARFVISLYARRPEIVEKQFRNRGDQFREILRKQAGAYEALTGPDDPPTADAYLDAAVPGYADDIGITLMEPVINKLASRIASEMEWCVVDVSKSTHRLIIGDNPLIVTMAMSEEKCLIALPISPSHIFFASRMSSYWEAIKKMSFNQLVNIMNDEMVGVARKEVYATDGSHKRFVENRLFRPIN